MEYLDAEGLPQFQQIIIPGNHGFDMPGQSSSQDWVIFRIRAALFSHWGGLNKLRGMTEPVESRPRISGNAFARFDLLNRAADFFNDPLTGEDADMSARLRDKAKV